MARLTIVLAHGVLGFGALRGLPSFVTYFNGVAAHLRRQGHTVFTPQVSPVGGAQQRGDKLAASILAQVAADTRVHILAHSLGGLDARHALARVDGFAERVATLVTIGTPHRGSPVADAIARRTGSLLPYIPGFVLQKLRENAGALRDLTTEAGIRFDEETPDAPGVRYINIAGDASRGSRKLLFWPLAEKIRGQSGEINDGMVTRGSALRAGHEHFEDWPVDHAGEVGWSWDSPLPVMAGLPFLRPAAHLRRYEAIVEALEP